jgi:hypothetical protein
VAGTSVRARLISHEQAQGGSHPLLKRAAATWTDGLGPGSIVLQIFIIFYSTWGHAKGFAEKVKEGVDEAGGDGILYQVRSDAPLPRTQSVLSFPQLSQCMLPMGLHGELTARPTCARACAGGRDAARRRAGEDARPRPPLARREFTIAQPRQAKSANHRPWAARVVHGRRRSR